jgi:hypothetical protein
MVLSLMLYPLNHSRILENSNWNMNTVDKDAHNLWPTLVLASAFATYFRQDLYLSHREKKAWREAESIE